jgi:monoamine oxidase
MAGSFYNALSGLLAPPLDPAERQARMAELARRKAPVDPPIDAACVRRVAETSVAVVGGGLAGLVAARRLARAGARVTLFEAGKEVGGRLRSSVDFSTGRIVEFGAELIGAIHPTWLDLAREYKLGLIGRSDVAHHAKTGLESRLTLDRPLTLREQIAVAEELTRWVLHPIGQWAKRINDPMRPWLQPSLKKFDSLSVADFLEGTLKITRGSRLWLAMELLLVNDDVAPLDELNLLGLMCLVKGGQFGAADKALMGYWTELEVFRSSEGCQSLALALAHEFETKLQGRLRRRRIVVAIDLTHRPLITSQGFDGHPLPAETEAFDYVVFALPPSVWPAVKITPVHPMESGQVGLMHSGPAVKFFSELDRRAWMDSGGAPLGGAVGLGLIWESTDQQARLPGQNPVLAVFAGGRLPAPESYEPSLEALYPGYRKARLKSYLMDWPNEPYIRTGYASPGKGQIFTVGQALNRPFGQRLVFAGEHTNMAYLGYMEGALQSGLSAAQQVLDLACSGPSLSKPKSQMLTAELGDDVIGHDDRVRVSDNFALPARWVCAIDLLVDDPKQGKGAPQIESLSRGTGILIGPSHVLTAAHVFDDASLEVDGRMRKVPVARVRVSLARNGDNTSHPLGAAYSKAVHRPPRFNVENDYALIVLDRDLSKATHKSMKGPLGYWGQSPKVAALRVLDPAKIGDPAICVIGYPGDRCGKDIITGDDAAQMESRIRYCAQRRHDEWASTAWQSSGTANPRAGTGLMLHDADTYEGESGGPIFLRRGDTLDLLGVHGGVVNVAGGGRPTHNRGARVTSSMLNDLRDWINADAGRMWADVRDDALVFLPAAAAHASEHAADCEFSEDDGTPTADTRRIGRAAAKIDEGLRAGEAALPQAQPRGRRELLAFVVSLLRTHFFPSGYGIVDATGKVARASARAILEMQVEKPDGSRWPFEHRLRLSISAKPPDCARWAGSHRGAFFSVITLFVGAFDGVSASAAAGAAVHEIVHTLFSMLRRLGQEFGDATADRFLATDPWRQLDMRPFADQSDALAAALDDLLKVLRLPVTTAELARSLVEEAFAYTMGREFSRAIEAADATHKPGPKLVIDAVSVADLLVRAYVLERSSVPATALAEPAVARAVRRLAPAIEALTDAMRGPGHAAFSPAPVHDDRIVAS